MMIKKILVIIFIFLTLPVWADEQGDVFNPFISPQDVFVEENPEDSVYLFEPGLYDNNPNPYSVYQGNTLQGGIQKNQSSSKLSSKEADLVHKFKKKKLGKIYVGNFPAGSLTRCVNGGYSLYQNDKFGIRNEYVKNAYKDEFTRNSIIISPEFYLSNNLTLRAFHGQTVERKGFEEGLALEYTLSNKKVKFKKIKNLRFEFSASKANDGKVDASQRFGFNTRYNF